MEKFKDDDWMLCPEEIPERLFEYIRNVVLAEDHVLLYKKGNILGFCYDCKEEVYAQPWSEKFYQGARVRCPNCGGLVQCVKEDSRNFLAENVENVVIAQKGTDGETVFFRQWRVLRDPSGEWNDLKKWLKDEVEFSERTAQNFMRIAKEYRNPQLISDIGNSASKAIMLLSMPVEEREEFVGEAHEINGEEKTVAEMTTKELQEVLKELDAERKEKEQLKKQLDLFEDEAQRKQDEAVDAAYSQGEEQIKRLSELKEQAEAAAREAEKKVAELQGEVSELQMQKEQTTLLDATELEKIRMEAEAEANKKAEAALQKKLDKAKKEAEKAKKEAKEAQAAIEAHEEAQKEAEETALALKERLKLVQEEADKKVRLAGNQEMAVFKVHFENVQMEFNEMMTCIDNLQEKEPEEAGKMRTAMKSLCQNIMQILEDKQ